MSNEEVTEINGPTSTYPMFTDSEMAAKIQEDASGLVFEQRALDSDIKDFVENICTPEEREQWYAYRKIKFQHSAIKKIAQAATGVAAPKHLPIVASALARTYLSQILDYANASKDSSTIQPKDLREGYRLYHMHQQKLKRY